MTTLDRQTRNAQCENPWERGRPRPLCLYLLALAACLATLAGCAPGGFRTMQRFTTREKAMTLIDQGKKLEREGSLILALERYDRAARIYESPEAYYRMGQVFETQGKPQEAATAYSKALELAPDYQEARLAAIALGFTPGSDPPSPEEVAQAREWGAQHAQQIAAMKAQQPNFETTTTVADLKGQRLEVIESAAQKRLPTQQEVAAVLFAPEIVAETLPSALNPVYANEQDIILATYPYHYQKAQQLRTRQLYDRAAEEFERAIQADPKQLDARIELGDMMIRLGRSDRARLQYEQAMAVFPASPQPLFKMGRYYSELHQPERAREFYRLALEKDPKYIEAYNNLGVLAMQEEKYPEAAQMFDQIMRLDPNYSNAYLNRGIIASDIEKNKDLALRCYKRYVELNGARAAQVRSWINEIENEEK